MFLIFKLSYHHDFNTIIIFALSTSKYNFTSIKPQYKLPFIWNKVQRHLFTLQFHLPAVKFQVAN